MCTLCVEIGQVRFVSHYIPLLVSDVPVPPASRPRTASPTNPVESLQGSPRAPVFICCTRDVLIHCVCVCVCVCVRARADT